MLQAFVTYLAAAGLLLLGPAAGDRTRVPTSTGVLLGKRSTAMERPLLQFLGVPYAQPPVGPLRFRPPLELISSATTEQNADRFAPSCYQPPHLASVISPLLRPNQAEVSEDCLYLNVYVPEAASDEVLPVMVWLPGEGFDYADPQQFDGSYLAVQGRVIVVTVNYRLSAFGFLASLSEEAPGNVGLLDQRMALRWVKKNIAKFGGDQENVTLFGRFSGSMSAAIHAFSPMSKDERLFQRVILQSGVPVGDWVFDRNPLNATLQLATASDCLFDDMSDVVTCLRRLPSDILLKHALSVPQRFRPIYDFNLVYENTLKAASGYNYAPVDVMIGINTDEGTLCTIALNAMRSPFYHKILEQSLTDADFRQLVASNMFEVFRESDHLSNKLASYEYLFQDSETKLRELFVDFCGDLHVTSHAQKLADVLALKQDSAVYMYEFAHRPSFSIHPDFVKAGHGDDVLFTMGLPFQLPNLGEDEARLTRRTVEAVANFARKSNPNRANASTPWPRYTSTRRQIMTFAKGEREEVVRTTSHEVAAVFWHDIIPAARRKPCLAEDGSQNRPLRNPSEGAPSFLGSFITVPAAEYLLLGLFCATLFLLATTLLAVTLLVKIKQHAAFQRLR